MDRSNFDRGRKNVENLLSEPFSEPLTDYFKREVEALITEKTFRHVEDNSKYVDIVGDVINLLPVRWASEKIVSASVYLMHSPHMSVGSLDFH